MTGYYPDSVTHPEGPDYDEIRVCNACGEEWLDSGGYQCLFCGSEDTEFAVFTDAKNEPSKDAP
jgi:hypothetical protein